MIYLYACVWAHYVYRSTMLWPAYFLVYELLPVMLLIFVIALPLRRLTRQQAY